MGNFIDMTGWVMKEHGIEDSRLTVLEKAENSYDGRVQWKCKCECGNIKIFKAKDIRSGKTKSCGCLVKDTLIQRNQNGKGKPNIKNIKIIPTGTKYGKLIVLELLGERTKDRHCIYKCECECGTIINVPGKDLKSGNTQSCGCIKSRGEEKISQILSSNNIIFEKEKTFDNCRFKDTDALARFDFYVDNKYIIEYDGEQHFSDKNVGWGIPLKEIQQKDEFKNQWCKENNIPIIRISYQNLNNICLEDLILETSKFIV